MTPLRRLLAEYRQASKTEREKGTYFEELIVVYLRNEASYKDYYSDVWTYADWAQEQGKDARDTGIDLVAKTRGTNEYHAIQCKFYAEDYRVQKKDIDSFFTASGQKPFTNRIIVTTTNNWSGNAEDALRDQQPPVTKIDLEALESSQIDWSKYQPNKKVTLKSKKTPRSHQKTAHKEVIAGFKTADRGKLIMACGTGKTFVSLKIAEDYAGKGKRVLFLVPSLSLLSQTLTEWTQESATPLHSFAVCSDAEVGKKRKKNEDVVETYAHELQYPATTDAKRLAEEMKNRHDSQHMSVVFSTYHSIRVISQAQKRYKVEDFDLIICDEAHRTTGATLVNESESNFVRVHDNDFIRAGKRLYMTATPRIYADVAKATAEKDAVTLCSMDDESLYGTNLSVLNFSTAVMRDLLVDYKVIVLTVDEAHVSKRLQELLKDDNNQLKVDDAAKIVGCWKAMSKQEQEDGLSDDKDPMSRAVAFCQVIDPKQNARKHKVSSKQIASMFQTVVEEYQRQEKDHHTLICEAEHVDGTMNATEKGEKLTWLKADTEENTCRILSNVRCLSEGVDVPALDAVLFLTPRNSQVDVVQSVGRVMRKDPSGKKKRGYVILPVVIPMGMTPSEALNDNQTYRVVWEVLQALRSHDDRFDAMINKLDLIGKDHQKMEVIAITDKMPQKRKSGKKGTGKGSYTVGTTSKQPNTVAELQTEFQFHVGEIERGLYAKVVKKCGNRHHWEDWANDIAKIANTHITRITTIVTDKKNKKEVAAFQAFADELRDDLNDSISDTEVIEMLAQHLITKPVFEALFKEYSFAKNNPVSQAMQDVLTVLQAHRIDKEADTLEQFYASVQMRAEGIDNAAGKQKIVVELYDKFFRNAFPKMTERLGIVYTPVEVVDFIIHSINDLLKSEFGKSLGHKGVHIIDPFTGTGTFITRLLQSGLISQKQLPHKYKNEIHANEIVLLAYYIAAINIEAVYHTVTNNEYHPFEGICLTDTFQLYEKEDLIRDRLADNTDRRIKQKNLDIRVIMGNPPYSSGQKSANDDAANIAYSTLDKRLSDTFVARSTEKGGKRSSYDSYRRAIRWAVDRVGNSGIVAFVTNASFLEANSDDGLRKCLSEELSSMYIFHLRGNQRTQGEMSRREGGKIFGSSSRSPIAISLLVKNPSPKAPKGIFFYDIGDYLNREEKLLKVASFHSLYKISEQKKWKTILPNQHGDWLNQRDTTSSQYMLLGDKGRDAAEAIFTSFSSGIVSGRDPWVFNFSKERLKTQCQRMVAFYNQEIERYSKYLEQGGDPKAEVQGFVKKETHEISWGGGNWQSSFRKCKTEAFNEGTIRLSLYRPFTKTWHYGGQRFNHSFYSMRKIFPNSSLNNLLICILGRGENKEFSVLMTDKIVEFKTLYNGKCFPLYQYEQNDDSQISLPLTNHENPQTASSEYKKVCAISDDSLASFQKTYPNLTITKEDIFFYIYGLLHSQEYTAKFADNLSKELPRIPCIASFSKISQAGRELADLHVHYETQPLYPAILDSGKIKNLSDQHYRVTKMKFKKKGDKSIVIYNEFITITGIPIEAYDYVVNGKPALEWVMERQAVTTDKKSGIVNDANLWATETMKNAKYPLELFMRVITVSLETMKIVRSLPKLDID